MNSKSKSKRCVAYVRTSTDLQDTAMQSRELTEYARLRGWNLTVVYDDSGYKGGNMNRPELNRLLRDARSRKFDLVLVWKLDRWGRSLREIVLMIQELADVGVEFCSLKDNLDLSSAQGRLMLHMIAAFAEYEAEVIRSRVRSGIANARAKGVRFGRPKTRDDHEIRRLRSDGLSLRKIAARLGVAKGTVQNALEGWTENPIRKTSSS
ncbi:MAG: recombinase family protein [Cryobacterium sp.]|nr:recombinase family protein [Oligoflexia bacterium]